MNEGLTSEETKQFLNLLTKANSVQIHSMLLSVRAEKEKREKQ